MTATIRKQSVSWANTPTFVSEDSGEAVFTVSNTPDGSTVFAREVYTVTASAISKLTKHTVPAQIFPLNKAKIEWFLDREEPAGYIDADDFEQQLISEDPAFAKSMLKARQKLSGELRASGLKAIRLNAGLSQAQLAQLIGTSQPHIARLEKSPESMYLDTAVKLSHALHIDLNEIASAAGLSAVKNR